LAEDKQQQGDQEKKQSQEPQQMPESKSESHQAIDDELFTDLPLDDKQLEKKAYQVMA